MNSQFKRIGFVMRPATPHIHTMAVTLMRLLLDWGCKVFVEGSFSIELMNDPIFSSCQVIDKEEMGKSCDLVISMGGDGTLLSIARKIAPYRVPLIGINRGRLGFLTQVPWDEALKRIPQMLQGRYIAEERSMLECKIVRSGKTLKQSLALNDAVFSRGGTGQMIQFEVFIDSQFVYTQHSDGLIVSTPTGPTAYALAAGGPILQPSVRAFVLVPICPQSMSNRPIAVSDRGEIEVLITKSLDARVHFDGQSYFDLEPMDRVTIRRYHNSLRMLMPSDHNYFKTLREKLNWGSQLV